MKFLLIIGGQPVPAERTPMEISFGIIIGEQSKVHVSRYLRISKRDRLPLERLCLPHSGICDILRTLTLDSDCLEFNERLTTMGESKLKNGFISKYHQQRFEQIVNKLDKYNNVLMSAVYLLTTDTKLWKQSKNYVEKNRICFAAFKPTGCTETGYTAYCSAKDVYLGSKHFTLSDLADKDIISPKLFEMLCMAMAIKRDGIEILNKCKNRSVR